jgi:sulfoxide reductase heme-binding subunit YedZ
MKDVIKRNWLWICISTSVLVFLIVVYQIRQEQTVKLSAVCGTALLLLTLIPNNLLLWVPASYSKLLALLRGLVIKRRDLGISSGIVFLFHIVFALTVYNSWNISFFLTKAMIFGSVGMFVVVLLLVTSNNYSIRLLKNNWKIIQSIVWVAIPFILIHSLLASISFTDEYSKIGILGFGGLLIFIIVESILFLINPQKTIPHKWRHLRFILLGSILAAALFLLYPNK